MMKNDRMAFSEFLTVLDLFRLSTRRSVMITCIFAVLCGRNGH
jgi:hypothetical protein